MVVCEEIVDHSLLFVLSKQFMRWVVLLDRFYEVLMPKVDINREEMVVLRAV